MESLYSKVMARADDRELAIARAEYRQLANRVRAASLRRQRSPWRRLYRRLGFAARVVLFALALGVIIIGIMCL